MRSEKGAGADGEREPAVGEGLERERGRVGVAIVEPYRMVRAALRALLERAPGVEVVAEAERYPGAPGGHGSAPADVLVMSVDAGAGLEALPPGGHRAARPRLIVLAGEGAEEASRRAAAAGASGFVKKCEPAATLLKAIEKVHGGEVWFDSATMATLIAEIAGLRPPESGDETESAVAALSGRERAIVAGVTEGRTNSEVAERCGTTEASVRHALTRIYGRLGVKNRMELARLALRAGIAAPDPARR